MAKIALPSTDGRGEIVFDYREKTPHIICVITSESNVGTRRNGLRSATPRILGAKRIQQACRGKYIVLILAVSVNGDRLLSSASPGFAGESGLVQHFAI